MFPFYADARKFVLMDTNPLIKSFEDKQAGQWVTVVSSVEGVTVRADKAWSPYCEGLFHKYEANRVQLERAEGSLEFVNGLERCNSVCVVSGKKVDLSPLTDNDRLVDVQLHKSATYLPFDLTSLPNLERCQVPLAPSLMSFLNCEGLVSLCLGGGSHEGELRLESLSSLREFVCVGVSKLTSVVLSPSVRLRSLSLAAMRQPFQLSPMASITEELRVVKLEGVPQFGMDWMGSAAKLECVALRQGEIPSVRFLSGLSRLQVLDLFGSKVLDGDLSVRDGLAGRLDSAYWRAA